MITDIFKTSIYTTQIKNDKYVNFFKKILKDQKRINKTGEKISNEGGYQTFNFKPLREPEICEEVFLKPSKAFCDKLNPRKKQYKIYNHSWWINENKLGDYNSLHNHSDPTKNIILSGIYYIETPKDSGRLVFLDSDYGKYSDNNFDYFDNPNFFAKYVFIPKKYDLILFPPGALHMVEPSKSKKSRISVAFNIGILDE